ncbi:MAG: hypothetical protein NZ866_01525 [Patescibacteria group bacterium]|nr:hypothetical protein [Patescibacteria group bacterium]
MIKRGQLESLITGIIFVLLFLSAIIYYFQFKTGTVPVFKPLREIKPAEKGVLPEGTFFEKRENKENKIPFFKINKVYAYSEKRNKKEIKYKPNKYLETLIIEPKTLTFLEDNILRIIFSGRNKNNPLEKIYFQYKLHPIQKDWQRIFSNQKVIILPKGKNFYTLYVRAINKNFEFDPSPAQAYIYTNISPYYKDINISINSNGDLLTIYNKSRERINIHQWRIISRRVNFLIPMAVRDVKPELELNLEEIILEPREKLFIYPLYATTATFIPRNFKYPYPQYSPLGFNFKVNKCFPYLAETRRELKNYLKNLNFPCQKFSNQELFDFKRKYFLSDNCLKILEKLSCVGPTMKDWQKIGFDSNCYRFFENYYTYYGCYYNKKNDKDFYLKSWLIFVPIYEKFAFSRYDEIKLYDRDGLLVNKKIIR